jgi:hypothetical protein
MRFDVLAEAEDVLALAPDVVIVATGGLPQSPPLAEGAGLVTGTWEILADDVPIAREVLVYDDNGGHPALQAAEKIAVSGAAVELATPERFFAAEMGGTNHAAYAELLHRHGARITINTRLVGVRREGNRLAAILGSDYDARIETRLVDQVVVEHGTLPADALYFALKERSSNRGEVDHRALLRLAPQRVVRNKEGGFQLFRIGDAVAARNIHAAIYDALRLCVAL